MQIFENAYGSTQFPVNVVNATTITATMQVPSNAPTEQATVWLLEGCDPEADMGCPDNYPGYLTFPVQIIGCPVPTITSVTPSTWFAGETYRNVTITGTNFITKDKPTADCPLTAVSIQGADGTVVPISNVSVDSKEKITLTGVAPPANTTTETATVTVGTAPSTATSASLATQPQILGNEIHCDPSLGCTQDVISTTDSSDPPPQDAVVGQKIALNANPNLPAAFTPIDTKWTVDGTKIAGYNPTTGPTDVTPLKPADLKKSAITFYWVYPNNASPVAIPVTYSYCVNIPGASPVKQCSLTAKASFNLSGPGDQQMTTDAYDRLNVDMLIDKNNCATIQDDSDPYLEYGNISGFEFPCLGTTTGNPQGIIFTPPPSSSGSYSFVQLISKDTTTYTFGKNVLSCPTIPGLDDRYPYPLAPPNFDKTWDYPGVKLVPSESKVSRTFKATMYLLWKSSKTGAIPVPIGSQNWTIAQGRTTNSGYPTSQNWTPPVWNSLGENGDPVDYVTSAPSNPSYGYPTWNGPAASAPVPGCPTDTTQADEAQQGEKQ
jgi:hypothetical protein